DYREYTLNWHATPGHTYRSTIVGIMVPPGPYTATLTVGGRKHTQPIVVVPDPRVRVPSGTFAAQLQLQQRMVAGLTASYDAFNYVMALRAALDSAVNRTKNTPAGDEIARTARSLD